jgi:hypothetical protein
VQAVSNVVQAVSNVVPAWRNRVRSHDEQTIDSEGEPAKLGSNGRYGSFGFRVLGLGVVMAPPGWSDEHVPK